MMKFLATLWLLIAVVAKPSSTTFSQNHEPCRPAVCPKIRKLDGVCDQEGKDYGNDCFFKVAACEAKKNGKILILTPCPHIKNQEPCPSVCPKILNLDGFFCDQEGKDYGNECFFEKAACEAKKNGKILIRTACPPVKELPAICMMPKKVGTCEAGKTRYFYNTKSTKCEKFLYGGCEGNGNNFMNIKECNRKCRSRQMDEVQCIWGCPYIYDPVCDNQGKEYPNECVFKAAKCSAEKRGEKLILAYCPRRGRKMDLKMIRNQ